MHCTLAVSLSQYQHVACALHFLFAVLLRYQALHAELRFEPCHSLYVVLPGYQALLVALPGLMRRTLPLSLAAP